MRSAKPLVYGLATVALTLAAGASAQAAPPLRCLPSPSGAPGRPWPPKFLTAPDAPSRSLDDTAWTGALGIDIGFGTGTLSKFRGGHSGNDNYLSWIIYTDTSAASPDGLWVGFSDGAAQGHIFHITFNAGTPAPGDDLGKSDGSGWKSEYWTRGSPTDAWTKLANAPAWFDGDVRMWVSGTSSYQWAVQMKVPRDATGTNGIKLPAQFEMWWQVERFMGTIVSVYTWPDATQAPNPTLGVFPDYTQWGLFDASGAACSEGIAFDAGDIGVATGGPGSMLTNSINPRGANQMTVRPHNLDGTQVNANTIQARFRLANWGAQIADPEAPWGDITGGGAVPNASAIPGLGTADISFPWTPTTAERCLYTNQTGCPPGSPLDHDPHQCMQVILSALSGGPITFRNDSAYRNMDIAPSSRFVADAQIGSGKNGGSRPLPSPDNHDYYLHVDVKNMPARIDPEKRSEASGGGRSGGGLSVDQAWAAIRYPGRFQGQLPTLNQISDVLPTYRVHTYQDTGKTMVRDGVRYKIVKQLTSFGYFADHQGPLVGWRSQIRAQDRGLEVIIPDKLYRVFPLFGIAHVTTGILACENADVCKERVLPPGPGPICRTTGGCCCDVGAPGRGLGVGLAAPALLLLLVAGWWSWRKRGRRARGG
jgi:hypothetical protein